MSSILKRSNNNLRLGDLLVQAGLLTQAQMGDAVKSSRAKKLQIGQVLVANGLLSPRDLQSALEAQSMLRDKSVEVNEALRCLKIAYKVGVPFKDILSEYTSPKRSQTSKLGELLVESGLVTYEVLARAVEQSYATGLPLGRMLVLQKTITNEVLTTALDLQVRVRDEMLSRAEAITTLRAQAGLAPLLPGDVSAEPAKPQALPHQDAPRKKGVRLGELMVMASVLTETDVMNALEWGLVNQQTIGQVLISQKLVSQELLDAALELQKLVDTDVLEPLKASDCLARVHSGSTLDEAVSEVKKEKESADLTLSYEKLLMLARVVGESEIEEAFDISTKSAAVLGKIMVLTGHMDVPTLQATLRCHQLLSRGLLTQDDAVVTLDYALHHISGVLKFDEALKQLGWSKDRGLRLKGEPTAGGGTAQVGSGGGGADIKVSTGADAREIKPPRPRSHGFIQTDFAADSEAGPESLAFPMRDDERLTLSTDVATQTSDNIQALPKDAVFDATALPEPISDFSVEGARSIPEVASKDSSKNASKNASEDVSQEADDKTAEDDASSSGRHNQTIQPEDARATRLAALLKTTMAADAAAANAADGGGESGGENQNDLLVNFDPSADPPDALHRVFERLAHSYYTQQNYDKAQVLYERILVHRMNQFGPSDSALVADLNNLAGVLVAQEKHNQAEPFMRRAVAILDANSRPDLLKIAECLSLLGNIYLKQEKLKEAEPPFKRALELRKARLEPGHSDIAQILADYAKLLRRLKREEEAEAMYQEAITLMANLETSTGQFTAIGVELSAPEESD
jgi:tetratricopeptide (TPR) repeat protein